MAINGIYPATSPYQSTDVVNKKFLDFMNYRPIPSYPSDILFTITEAYQYRPDLLAYDLYGDARLWWVFSVRNPNKLGPDPYFNFTSGTSIYIPTLSTLKSALGI